MPKLDDPYVCRTVCAECPFRIVGSQAVRIAPATAQRIADDVRNPTKMFPCHMTSSPNGLDEPNDSDKGNWRFCAGAYLAMNQLERAQNLPLRIATALGYFDPDSPPAGAGVVFSTLDAFTTYYSRS